ncbi:hypothetical protein BU23DRAFT_495390 [Bimuria novae-zelandiae CBS 107.79]|uniref:Uncharacterized protein n=1 Tax=Bimuria novae-zelandiae CBS 107.79 TaxID=1447943 RepID=A0A6A5VU61_9PLEO|nr:hypothetical protein BU23DRAFT_495390 [Bimuria novae-zelandiae CBS 107.79]
MPFRSGSRRYINIGAKDNANGAKEPWYWRFIAQAASWTILCGYLILPGLYAKDPQLKISQPVLTVFVVALLTAGYSFTALLCFACRNERFQAEAIFLPALTSSAIGLLTIAYNFLASTAYVWGTSAISGTVVSTTSTFLYGMLLLWTHRRIVTLRELETSRSNNVLYNEPQYYSNFVQNMYPAAARSPSAPPEPPLSEEDRINQQMALLLMKQDSGTSPDAASATFRIDLPEDHEQRERIANSQELVGTPPISHPEWSRARSQSRPDSLSETQAWERWQDRGRTTNRPASIGARSNHSRAMSREERRREIELGLGPA